NEAAGDKAGEPALDAGTLRVHVLDEDLLVALEKTVDPLILGRDVEEGRRGVRREAGEVFFEPVLIVRPRTSPALSEGDVHWQEAGGLGPVRGRAQERAVVVDVGKRDRAPAAHQRL